MRPDTHILYARLEILMLLQYPDVFVDTPENRQTDNKSGAKLRLDYQKVSRVIREQVIYTLKCNIHNAGSYRSLDECVRSLCDSRKISGSRRYEG